MEVGVVERDDTNSATRTRWTSQLKQKLDVSALRGAVVTADEEADGSILTGEPSEDLDEVAEGFSAEEPGLQADSRHGLVVAHSGEPGAECLIRVT